MGTKRSILLHPNASTHHHAASGDASATAFWRWERYATFAYSKIVFIDGSDTYRDWIFHLPSDYSSGLEASIVWSSPNTTASLSWVWTLQAATAAAGEAAFPTLSESSNFSQVDAVTEAFNISDYNAVPGTHAAGDTVLFRLRRVGADGSDNLTNTADVYGIIIRYDSGDGAYLNSTTNTEIFIPTGLGVYGPTLGDDTQLELVADSNTSKLVVSYPGDISDTHDYFFCIPWMGDGATTAGGTVTLHCRTPATSSTSASFDLAGAVLADGAAVDYNPAVLGTSITLTTPSTAYEPMIGYTVMNTAAEGVLCLRVRRDATDIADDNTSAVQLLGISINYGSLHQSG